ncbi:MAG: ribonuclease E/G, partial [Steroidobacteraceae bacterium]
MSTEMVVNVSPRETRAALLENGVLQELFVERASRLGLTGNLYKGRVSRVLPGMQAAFIDIGLERTAFLHVSDIVQPADAEGASEALRTENIRELVSEGGDILVQVLKDPLGTKGARLTTFVTIPSRYLVYMPFGHGVGISARIETEEERNRLRELLQSSVTPGQPGGYIVRTAAEGAGADALRADMLFLRKLWEVLSQKAATARAGALVHEDLPLPLRLMRDLVGEGVDRVLVDNERTCERMQEFATTFMPGLGARVERYTGSRPIFDLHGVEEEIQRSLER